MIYDKSGTVVLVDGNDPESMVVNHRVTNFSQLRSIRTVVMR